MFFSCFEQRAGDNTTTSSTTGRTKTFRQNGTVVTCYILNVKDDKNTITCLGTCPISGESCFLNSQGCSCMKNSTSKIIIFSLFFISFSV